MEYRWLDQTMTYDGSQLRSLFAYKEIGLLGDSLISWRGPCDVQRQFMVDMEDWTQGAEIQGQDMLHFIMEIFHTPLMVAVGYQRLFVGLLKETLCEFLALKSDSLPSILTGFYSKLRREGDDLYFEDKKINVSIATASPVSSLIHVGVNIKSEGTPVLTMGLDDFQIDPVTFAKKVMGYWIAEDQSMKDATCKVKGVF